MIEGSCHCGAVRWTFQGVPESATACNCTVSRRYGTLWAYDYDGEGTRVTGPTQVYTRGPHIGFHFCPTCGASPIGAGSRRARTAGAGSPSTSG